MLCESIYLKLKRRQTLVAKKKKKKRISDCHFLGLGQRLIAMTYKGMPWDNGSIYFHYGNSRKDCVQNAMTAHLK